MDYSANLVENRATITSTGDGRRIEYGGHLGNDSRGWQTQNERTNVIEFMVIADEQGKNLRQAHLLWLIGEL